MTIDVEPTDSSLQAKISQDIISVTDSETPYHLNFVLDSAQYRLFGNVTPDGVATIIQVGGKTVLDENVGGNFNTGFVNTTNDSIDLHYTLTKADYITIDTLMRKKIGEIEEDFILQQIIPDTAKYRMQVFSSDEADFTIEKFLPFTISGGSHLTEEYKTINPTEQDSIEVAVHGELEHNKDIDTLMWIYANQTTPHTFTFTPDTGYYKMTVTAPNGADFTIERENNPGTDLFTPFTTTENPYQTEEIETTNTSELDSMKINIHGELLNSKDLDTLIWIYNKQANTHTFTFTPDTGYYSMSIAAPVGADFIIERESNPGTDLFTPFNITENPYQTEEVETINISELDSMKVSIHGELLNNKDIDTLMWIYNKQTNTHTFTFTPDTAYYKMTITSDNGAEFNIKEFGTTNELWNFSATGSPYTTTTHERTSDYDSLQVKIDAALAGKEPLDTALWIYPGQANSHSFPLEDIVLNFYANGLIGIDREDSQQVCRAEITLTRKDNPSITKDIDMDACYDLFDSLAVDEVGTTTYLVSIDPIPGETPFIPYSGEKNFTEGDNGLVQFIVDTIPQRVDLVVNTFYEKDSTDFAGVTVKYFNSIHSLLAQGTSDGNGKTTLEDIPAGTDGYFDVRKEGADASDYYQYRNVTHDIQDQINSVADTTENVLVFIPTTQQKIPGKNTGTSADSMHVAALYIRSNVGTKYNIFQAMELKDKVSTYWIVDGGGDTREEKIARLEYIVHKGDSLYNNGVETIEIVDTQIPFSADARARFDPYDNTTWNAIDSLGWKVIDGTNTTYPDNKTLSNGDFVIIGGRFELTWGSDDGEIKETQVRKDGRTYSSGTHTEQKRTASHLSKRLEKLRWKARYYENATSFTAKYLYDSSE